MRNTVAELAQKYKSRLQEWLLPAIFVLMGLLSFGLGRLSVLEEQGPRLVIRMPDGTIETLAKGSGQAAAAAAAQPAATGAYVASKSGTKYYVPSCSGVSRIKEENKVWFATIGDAEAAGYTAAANCPGL